MSPIDLLALNTPISIKASSHVVANPSPHNLFIRVPQGLTNLKRSKNWYLQTTLVEYQLLYLFTRNTWCPDYPELVTNYHASTSEAERKVFSDRIEVAEQLNTLEFQKYQALYVSMCHKVAERSAEIFNQHLSGSTNNSERNSVAETIIRYFFRIGDVKYILCGLDVGHEFAVEIPDITTWKRTWKFESLFATPDLTAKQSIVKFHLFFERKDTKEQHELIYHAQIRWSHGRFCGNPEAKLYKEFLWTQVPFFVQIIKDEIFHKLQLIGSGGFGVVYKAINKVTKENVAVKELSNSTQDLHEYERFKREVKIQSRLDHPHILPVLQSDLSAPVPWFAMPLARHNLEQIIEESSQTNNDFKWVDFIFWQILTGMEYAHKNQVVHRDLKPANILLFDNDQVKISDFGLGKLLDPNSSDWKLTSTSESMGSLHYAAPEQMQSFAKADFRSDIYSLGKILYNLLTGDVPFPNLKLNLLDEHYKTIISRCTEEEPNNRYQSITQLMEAFKA